MKNTTVLTVIFALVQINLAYLQPPTAQFIGIPKPVPVPQQCQQIQGVGNPINLLKVLFDVVNDSLKANSNTQVTLIYQNVQNQLHTYVFRMQSPQSVDYVAIVYRDAYLQGAVIHQILTEDLSMINRALNLNIYDNGTTIYCPDIVCSWNGNCQVPTNCYNCPNCPGCQTQNNLGGGGVQIPPYCNQCPNCNGCPGAANHNMGGGFSLGGSTMFVLGESAPEELYDEE